MQTSIHEICQIPLREAQKKILKQVKPGKINLAIAPTGVGKSYIAAHLAQAHRGAMIITPNRALQSQYFDEMELANLWGQAHYKCGRYNVSCDKCDEALAEEIDDLKETDPEYEIKKEAIIEAHKNNCEYLLERDSFKSSSFGVTGVELCYFGIRNRSRCLIIDEAHNLIDKMVNLSGCKVSSNSTLFGDIFKALNEKFSKRKVTFNHFLDECIITAEKNEYDNNEVKRAKKKNYIQRLKDIRENISFFSYEIEINKKTKTPSTEIKKLGFKSEFRKLIKEFDHIYMLTATLSDVRIFCSILGIDKDEICVGRVESPFSPENVKVICYTDAVLTSKEYDRNIDRAVEIVDEILFEQPDRGIIHCTSFRQIEDIKKRISLENFQRLIIDDGSKAKDELLADLRSVSNGVLLSASAHEGIDLKGDLGKFSVTFKAPFPMWSPWVQAMDSRYYNYYHSQALSRFIQGLGRCIRKFDDKATIYLVDRCCGRFIKDREIPANIRYAERVILDMKKAG